MSRPHADESGTPLVPSRRGRQRERSGEEAPDEQADLDRGRTVALLGTLGRMQLRLDVLARQQEEAFASLHAVLERLDRRVAAIEAVALEESERYDPAAPEDAARA